MSLLRLILAKNEIVFTTLHRTIHTFQQKFSGPGTTKGAWETRVNKPTKQKNLFAGRDYILADRIRQ